MLPAFKHALNNSRGHIPVLVSDSDQTNRKKLLREV